MEARAATTLLHEPLTFAIKGRKYKIAGLYLGTLVIMSRLMTRINFDKTRLKADPIPAAMEAVDKNAKLAARIVAVAMLNNPVKIKLFSRFLALRLYWTVDSSALSRLVDAVLSQSGVVDFTYTIVSLNAASVTSRRETSPNGTEERIASGGQSAT